MRWSTARAGDPVCLHRGTPTGRRQQGCLRKVYLTPADPRAGLPVKDGAAGGVIVPDRPPASSDVEAFRNDPGTMRARHVAPGGACSAPRAPRHRALCR